MHRNDKPETIAPDVKDDKSINLVRIGKTCTQLLEVPPSSGLRNSYPRADLLGGFSMVFGRKLKTFDRDDAHLTNVLRNLRSVN
jgi:hypothetical protein